MKKVALSLIILSLMFYFGACSKKEAPKTEPVKAQQSVQKVEEKKPVAERPTLTEEEIFQNKSIEQLNKDQVLKRINFDFDKYDIREDAKSILQTNANWMLRYKTTEILIEGHCDERGTDEYNIALGEKRADSAKKYMTSLGISDKRIRIISYGKNKPLVTGHDEDSFAQNRRGEFIIVKK
jgi:peptidoglycan-associated lipoprotein